jgi:predicted O-linked N-acetylglucosamine transferase (SPINDLY family)
MGLDRLIASNEADYVALAARTARDAAFLSECRSSLRERLRASAIMDEAGFTRRLEGAFRDAWRRRCAA